MRRSCGRAYDVGYGGALGPAGTTESPRLSRDRSSRNTSSPRAISRRGVYYKPHICGYRTAWGLSILNAMRARKPSPRVRVNDDICPRAQWLRRARLSIALTQEHLGLALGWHYTSVSGWENARRSEDVPNWVMYAIHGFTGYPLPAELGGNRARLEG